MAAVEPWVLLGRVIHVGFLPGVVGAGEELWEEAGLAAVGGAEGQFALAAAVMAAGEDRPDFTFPFEPPPRAILVTAGYGAHPWPASPDMFPYIIAAGPLCILAHFAGGLFRGTNFDDFPLNTHFVVMRFFELGAGGVTTATAEHIPERHGFPDLLNVGNVGLYSDNQGRFKIAELQVDRGLNFARIICFPPNLDGPPEWETTELEHPMPAEDREARDWVPHGAVTLHSTVWWFDLSWGIMSCDIDDDAMPDLIFHPLPDGRVLAAATPDIHTRRCITVSRRRLRYAEIITDGGGAPTLCMWSRRIIGQQGWTWEPNHAMSFEVLWDDDTYVQTGLPRNVPVLVAVCPSNPNFVYFALEQRIFGVNVRERIVFNDEPYALVNIPGAPPLPPSSRYVLAWDLPRHVAIDLGVYPFPQFHAGQQAAAGNDEEPEEGGLTEEEDEPVEEVSGEDELVQVQEVGGENSQPSGIDLGEPQPQGQGAIPPGAEIRHIHGFQRRNNEQQAIENSEEQEVDMPETAKAELKAFFDNMDEDRPGPSQDPRDDAGEGAV